LKKYGPVGPTGNHTWSHAMLTALPPKQVRSQMNDAQGVIERLTGENNRIMRPPYGARNKRTVKIIDKLGYAEILWSADSQDGLAKPAKVVAKNAIDGLGPGAVILMHDGPDATLEALRKKVIPAIRRSNLTMLSIPDLLVLNKPSNRQLDAGPRGCTHAGRVNVSGYFRENPEG
jgi:peptidoglycan/xylan/chitin deacetylase (PgdA/CDA1 family)